MTEDEMRAMSEIYSEIDAERQWRDEEFEAMKSQLRAINALLDSYLIPNTRGGKLMTALERIDCLLREWAYA